MNTKSNDLNPRRFEIESAVMGLEGDSLLLNLAINDVFGKRNEHEEGWYVYRLTGDQVRAITHANGHVFQGVRELSKAYYGEVIDDP